MHKFDYERIEQILWDDFEAARKKRDEAMESFGEVMSDIPSGLPHPDGTQRIKKTSRQYTEAREKLTRAMNRLNDFKNRGIVPDDLEHRPNQLKNSGGGKIWRTLAAQRARLA